MNAVTRIQQELNELSDQISKLSRELDSLKAKPAADVEAAYEKIKFIAMQHPIKNRKLRKATEPVKKEYFRMLAFISNYERNGFEDKLLFIQRMAAGVGYSLEPEELVRSGIITEPSLLNDIVEQLGGHKYSLLLDCLLAANMSGAATTEGLRIIAELASLFSLEQEELATLAALAKCLIQQDENDFAQLSTADTAKWRGIFIHHMPEEWLQRARIHCGTYSVAVRKRWYQPLTVLSQMKKGSFARKGEVIVTYETNGRKRSIKAKQDGIVAYVESRIKTDSGDTEVETQVFTVSCFDELTGWKPGKGAKA